jgi:hypothetical protein
MAALTRSDARRRTGSVSVRTVVILLPLILLDTAANPNGPAHDWHRILSRNDLGRNRTGAKVPAAKSAGGGSAADFGLG